MAATILWGIPAGDDFSWDLTYKFKTEDGIYDITGNPVAFAKYSKPTRELKFSIGAERDDTFSRLSAFLVAGATFVTVPMWFLRTNLLEPVTSGSSYFKVSSSDELLVGEQALFLRTFQPSTCELVTIDSIIEPPVGATVGATINITSPFVYDYNPFNMVTVDGDSFDTLSAFVLPTLTGVLDYESVDFIDGLPGIGMKAKIDGGAWQNYNIPAMPSFSNLPMETKYNVPKITKDLNGVENGILDLYAYGSSSRLTFECTWNFKDSDWQTLRDIFFVVRGKASVLSMPTFMYELGTTRGADQGSTTIYLDAGYQYLYQRFPRLIVYNRFDGTQSLITITGHVSEDQFTCEELPYEIYGNEKVCFYPYVRFDSDDLTFSFKGLNVCTVKATFIEEPSD